MTQTATPPALPLNSQLSRAILLLALPMVGEQLLNLTVAMFDTWLAGRISKEATAAVGTASYLHWFVNLCFTLVGTGAGALISRAVGARDLPLANRVVHQAVLLAVCLGAGAVAVALWAAPQMAWFLTRTPEARELCTSFLRIVSFSFLLASVNLVGGALLRAAGRPRVPLMVMGVVNLVNVIASSALVFGWGVPKFGVAGIATGTLIARCVGGLLMLAILTAGVGPLRLEWRGSLLDPGLMRRILRIGLPAAGESAIMAFAQLTFIKIISHTGEGDLATANYAAHMIAMEAEALNYLPAMGWGSAAATLIGQHLGAGQPDVAYRAGRLAARQAFWIGAGSGAVFILAANAVFAVFSVDALVRSVGPPAFRLLGLVQPFLAAGIVYLMALRGAGDTRWPMYFSIVGGVGLRIPFAWIGGIFLDGGLIGAWCGMWADNVSRHVMASWRFRRGHWQKTQV